MGNRTLRSLRRNWRRIAVTGVATAGIVGMSATAGYTAAQIGSAGIKNQSIRSVDISRNGVGASELRGPAHEAGPAVRSYHVKDQSLGHWDIRDGTLGGWDVRDGSLKEKELSEKVQTKLNAKGGGKQGPPGEDGEDGVSGYEVVGVEERFEPGRHTLTAECPDGKVAIGGGHQASADGDGGFNTEVASADLSGLSQTDDGAWQATSYTVSFDNSEATSPGGGNMRVRVTCAAVN